MDAKATHGWLRDSSLRPTTDALVVVAQDQVIHTMPYKAKILRQHVSPLCRACGEGEETIAHIIWPGAPATTGASVEEEPVRQLG